MGNIPEIKILKLLLNNKEARFTIKKIAETLKINYRTAHENVLKLESESLVKTTLMGNSRMCEFTYRFNPKVFEAEAERRGDLFKNKDFMILHNRLAELKFPFIALLFGSHAKGTATKHSDIDLLLISDEVYFKKVQETIAIFPQDIHLTPMTYKSFLRMARSKEFSVVSEVLKKNFILIGIEEYYRLLKNVSER